MFCIVPRDTLYFLARAIWLELMLSLISSTFSFNVRVFELVEAILGKWLKTDASSIQRPVDKIDFDARIFFLQRTSTAAANCALPRDQSITIPLWPYSAASYKLDNSSIFPNQWLSGRILGNRYFHHRLQRARVAKRREVIQKSLASITKWTRVPTYRGPKCRSGLKNRC